MDRDSVLGRERRVAIGEGGGFREVLEFGEEYRERVLEVVQEGEHLGGGGPGAGVKPSGAHYVDRARLARTPTQPFTQAPIAASSGVGEAS